MGTFSMPTHDLFVICNSSVYNFNSNIIMYRQNKFFVNNFFQELLNTLILDAIRKQNNCSRI